MTDVLPRVDFVADPGPAFYPDQRPRRPIWLSGAENKALRQLEAEGYDIGLLATPDTYKADKVAAFRTWALDNACFNHGDDFDPIAWVQWMASFPAPGIRFGNHGFSYESRLMCAHNSPMGTYGCLFATAPDVVGDSDKTWARSVPWFQTIRRLGFPAALVAQNGMENDPRPWDECDSWDCLFIGGDDEFKESQEAADLAREAQLTGKWVHAGRVNSYRRILKMARYIDSADGTLLAFAPDKNIDRVRSWLDNFAAVPLFPEAGVFPVNDINSPAYTRGDVDNNGSSWAALTGCHGSSQTKPVEAKTRRNVKEA